MNALFISLESLYTEKAKDPKAGNVLSIFKSYLLGLFSGSESPENLSTDYILTDLASNLAIHLLDNDDEIFKRLETGNFSAFIKTAAENGAELSKNFENAIDKPKESQSKED